MELLALFADEWSNDKSPSVDENTTALHDIHSSTPYTPPGHATSNETRVVREIDSTASGAVRYDA